VLKSTLDLECFIVERTAARNGVDNVITLLEGVSHMKLLGHVICVVRFIKYEFTLLAPLIGNFLPDLLN
jgi:hypothetical protein